MSRRLCVIENFNRNLRMRKIVEASPPHWKKLQECDIKVFGASELREAKLLQFEGCHEYSLSFSDGRYVHFRT